jgi:hypothetical protein
MKLSPNRRMAFLSSAISGSEQTENPSSTPPASAFQSLTFPDLKPPIQPVVSQQESIEEIVTKDLEEWSAKRAVRIGNPTRQATSEPAVSEAIAKQLEEWNETEPIDFSPPPGFQDPLGHLTDAEQIAYLNDPPPAYLETLEHRAADREEYEKLLYLSAPVKNWRLAYPVEPSYEEDGIKPWVPWSPDKKLAVMEKLRRYDERFQARYRAIYRHFDGRAARQAAQKRLIAKLARPLPKPEPFTPTGKTKKERRRQREEHAQRMKTERAKAEVNPAAKGMPPKEVFDVMIWRDVIRSRNTALLEGQTTAFEELERFADITEDGVIVNAQVNQVRWKKEIEKEERVRKEEWNQWQNMSGDLKAQTVDWGAIAVD